VDGCEVLRLGWFFKPINNGMFTTVLKKGAGDFALFISPKAPVKLIERQAGGW
jgi:hypothetical protein